MQNKGYTKQTSRIVLTFLVQYGVISTGYGKSINSNADLTQATQLVACYFDLGCNLMYAIGAVLGLIGAVKVYLKWNHGDYDTIKVATTWFGSCIFLVIVATILKAFYGIS